VKGNRSGGHFVEHGAEGEKVGAGIEFLAESLLRRHVGDGAKDAVTAADGVLGNSRGVTGGGRNGSLKRHFGEPEVEQLGLAARGDENVGRLDVTMNDALGVRGVEGVGDLNAEVEKEIEPQRLAGDTLAEVLAIEQLHGEKGAAFVLAYFVDSANVGMVERRGGACFAIEPFECLGGVGEGFRQELQSSMAAKAEVLRFENFSHAPGTQLAQDAVVRDDLGEHDPYPE